MVRRMPLEFVQLILVVMAINIAIVLAMSAAANDAADNVSAAVFVDFASRRDRIAMTLLFSVSL